MSKVVKPPYWRRINHWHPLAKGLAGCWLFNEGTGNKIRDLSSYGNHGTISGASWVAGKDGHALTLNGTSDYIDCGSKAILDITDAVSILMWLKPTNSGAHSYPLSKGNNYGIIIVEGNDKWQLRYRNGPTVHRYSMDDAINYGVRQHLAVTYESAVAASAKIYLDGREKSGGWVAGDGTDSLGTNSDNLLIGAFVTPTYYYLGEIGMVAIYNRALSAEEIAWLYREPYAMFCGS